MCKCSLDIRNAIFSAGACHIAMEILENFNENYPELIEHACELLYYLSEGSRDNLQQVFQETNEGKDIIEFGRSNKWIIKLLRNFQIIEKFNSSF